MQTLNGTNEITVVLADSQTLTSEGIAAILAPADDIRLVGVASDPRQLLDALGGNPQVLLIDAKLLEELGDQELAEMRSVSPDTVFVVLADEANATRVASLAPSEAKGLVLRTSNSESLQKAIRAVAAGKTWDMPERGAGRAGIRGRDLSAREQDIAALVAKGLANRDIAQRLGLSEQSVKNLVSRILKKKGLTNRVQIALERWSSSEW
ncbi:MAG: response regulator transcription factor [Armatimonadetes bacterium]|nr:response regulator transcription factor [Armatimonadota bacterium]